MQKWSHWDMKNFITFTTMMQMNETYFINTEDYEYLLRQIISLGAEFVCLVSDEKPFSRINEEEIIGNLRLAGFKLL